MKNSIILIIATIFMLSGMSSCIIVEDDFDPGPPVPPCEFNATGQVCFDNNTDLDMFIRTDGYNLDVWSYSTTCVEIPAGYHLFSGIAGVFRWEGSYDVFVCERTNVFLDYRNQ